jgi:predicted transcriptional regulator
MVTAGEFCKRDVAIASSGDRVCVLARSMRALGVGSVVIVDERAEGCVPTGIVTDRDIVVDLIATRPGEVEKATAKEMIHGRLVVAREEEGLEEVVARMRLEGVRRIPVIDCQGKLLGIIALDDLVQHFAQELGGLASLALRQQHASSEHLAELAVVR